MERENTRKPASKAFVLSLFVITIILIILLFFIKISPRGVIDPNAVSIRQYSGEIQYKYADGNWQKIVSLEDLKNKDNGANKEDGKKESSKSDSREIEIQKNSLYIQWRYTGESEWKNIIAYSDLKGKDGRDGRDGLDGQNGRNGRDGRMVLMVRMVEMAKKATKATLVRRVLLGQLEPRELQVLPVQLVLQERLVEMLLFL